MYIVISNKIKISNYDSKFLEWVRENYVIPNPEYVTRARLNKYRWNIPQTLNIYEKENGEILLPYGCLDDVYSYVIWHCGIDNVTFDVELNTDQVANWEGNDLTPRPHQAPAVDAMYESKFGILKAPCSSGKTIMGHILAKRVGMKTLWLTHTQSLLKQSKEVGVSMLGDDGRVGTITEGKFKPGDTITYATVQTMVTIDPSLYKNMFNCVIVDECHRCNSKDAYTQMSYVVNNISAEYKYGLSATPVTHDGYGKTVLCNLGGVKYRIEQEELEQNNMVMPVVIKPIVTEWKYPEEAYRANGTVDFKDSVKYLYADEKRNKQIVELIGNRPTMILSSNIDHLLYIINQLSDEQVERACLIVTKHSNGIPEKDILCNHSAKSRELYLDMMRNGQLDIMFSTYQLAKEGLNIPRLEQVIMAFPAVEPNIVTQVIGRVARTCEGKTTAVCYDLVDKPTYFRKKFTARKKLYKELGNKVL